MPPSTVELIGPDDGGQTLRWCYRREPRTGTDARWAWDWMASWGLIDGKFDVTTQIDRRMEGAAHGRAREAHASPR